MNKEKFLTKLRQRLNVLEDSEIEDIVSEYEGYIEEKVATGMTEKEAVKELGDFEEIVSDLLSAYKLKNTEETPSNLNGLITKFTKFIESLSTKSGKEILGILIEIILILIFLGFLRLPFLLISDLGENFFHNLSMPLTDIFESIWEFIIELSYIILSVIIFIKFLENRLFAKLSNEILSNTKKVSPTSKEFKEEPSLKEERDKNAPSLKSTNVGTYITNILLIFLKFICICFLIGLFFYILGITIALSIMLYLIINKVKYYGILILLLSLFFGGIYFLKLGLKFITNKKIKAIPAITEIFIIIIFTAIGLTISTIEITNTEIIYAKNTENSKVITKTIPYQDNLKIYGYDEIKIDDTLDNNLRIEYTYPDILSNALIEIELDNCGYNNLCLETDLQAFSLNKNFFNTFITNLKANKIIIYNKYSITKTVYASLDNYNKLINTTPNIPNEDIPNYTPQTENLTYIYKIINITTKNNYQYLTLKTIYNNEIETIRLTKTYPNLEIGKEYKFTFSNPYHIYDIPDTDDIDDIFEEFNLISIEPNIS